MKDGEIGTPFSSALVSVGLASLSERRRLREGQKAAITIVDGRVPITPARRNFSRRGLAGRRPSSQYYDSQPRSINPPTTSRVLIETHRWPTSGCCAISIQYHRDGYVSCAGKRQREDDDELTDILEECKTQTSTSHGILNSQLDMSVAHNEVNFC